MKTQDMQKWNKKLAGFMAVIGASALIYLPTMAQAGSRNNETSQNQSAYFQSAQPRRYVCIWGNDLRERYHSSDRFCQR
ncbi:hypothetical protein ACE1CD_13930 [Aerosakkonema sp. BLCC-F183]|uniref:hypothetical protein n=1 Tax=Aerosakkonema sp. BLCC-F183 TaxID=3342834 RepID=UPI0035B9B1D8